MKVWGSPVLGGPENCSTGASGERTGWMKEGTTTEEAEKKKRRRSGLGLDGDISVVTGMEKNSCRSLVTGPITLRGIEGAT